MDREQARFILSSFRAGGADRADPGFAAALELADADPELGQWLASERAFDAAFAAALVRVPLPEPLRQHILDHLAIERGDVPAAADALDAAVMGAVAAIQPPPVLRVQVLAAMDRSAMGGRPRGWSWRRLAIPLAAAAGIALAWEIFPEPEPPQSVAVPLLGMDVIESESLRAFENPDVTLVQNREDHQVLIRHLKEWKLPDPRCLPRGLANVKGIGCRELEIDGKVGTIICFDARDNGVVHLVIFQRQDVGCGQRRCDQPELVRHGKWSVARWADAERVFILFGDHTNLNQLSALF
ncbi:MAG: hypothetical protein RLZZ522_2249 [Verrucomicrobiota bacterium]